MTDWGEIVDIAINFVDIKSLDKVERRSVISTTSDGFARSGGTKQEQLG